MNALASLRVDFEAVVRLYLDFLHHMCDNDEQREMSPHLERAHSNIRILLQLFPIKLAGINLDTLPG